MNKFRDEPIVNDPSVINLRSSIESLLEKLNFACWVIVQHEKTIAARDAEIAQLRRKIGADE